MTPGARGFHLRYSGPSRGPEYERWRELFGSRWIAADFEPLSGSHIDNQIAGSTHAFLTIGAQRGTPSRMVSRSARIRDPVSYVYLLVASGAQLTAESRGRSVDLAPGQAALMTSDEGSQVTQLTAGTRFSLRLPRKLVAEVSRDIDSKLARPLEADPPLMKLIVHQAEIARRLGPTLDSAANHAMAQHILDLIGLCIGTAKDSAQLAMHRGVAAARLDAIREDILKHLGTIACDLPAVALRHRVSIRYVQHLFERSGTTFTNFVREQRLLAAHRLLRDPKCRWRKVSDIAYSVGFSDLSYFHRAFKSRFGATPSDIRQIEGEQTLAS
jgi:AraC-like DNA-binding protein